MKSSKTEQQHQPGRPLTPEEFRSLIEEIERRSGRRLRMRAVRSCKVAFRDQRLRWLELHKEALEEWVRDPVAFFVAAIRDGDHLTEPLSEVASSDDSALEESSAAGAEPGDDTVAKLIAHNLSPTWSGNGLPHAGAAWHELEGIPRFQAIAQQLTGADKRTPFTLAMAAKGLPEAAIHGALESLEERRGKRPKLESEARYFVATLKEMWDEGRYS